MNDLKIFENTEFGQMVILVEGGKELFPASQVAVALGYANPHKAISDHCRYLTKREVPHPQSIDKTIELNFIPEGDLYRLIVKSQLPAAERFERWVFEEVLPTIRKHGMYATPTTIESMLSDPDTMIRTLTALKEERAARIVAEATVSAQAPKVLFADSVAGSAGGILVRDMAKILCQNGFDIGEKRFYDWLRKHGYVIKNDGSDKNMPTQKAMELKVMDIREGTRINAEGVVKPLKTTLVTGKGQIYFANKFKELFKKEA
jgi:anti-repressor protein